MKGDFFCVALINRKTKFRKEPIMTLKGVVHNGVVVLEAPSVLPEGTPVAVNPLPRKKKNKENIAKVLLSFAGAGKNLPPDLAENHDHYAHGKPKK
jgi:hypothetical protein